MLANLKKLDIPAIASEAVAGVVDVIADLNATQLSQGLRADGSQTLPSYTDVTIAMKRAKGGGLEGVSDRVTLYDTGAFYRGLYAAVQGTDIEYGSRDEKEGKLQDKYSVSGGSIFGLNEDSKDELIGSGLRAAWEAGVEKVTGLQFQ